jgi:hypothetical protein
MRASGKCNPILEKQFGEKNFVPIFAPLLKAFERMIQ